jgi:1-acyl-sn-glycerol-3-phosphate acyltransferase
MIYFLGRSFFWIMSLLFYPIKTIGRENLPTSEAFIIASNHVSNLDPFVIGLASGRKLSYVAKEELFRNKIQGFILSQWGAFPVKRESSDFRAMRETLRRLKAGSSIVLFPEGTRAQQGVDRPIQEGVGFIAAKSAVVVIPTYVKDTDLSLPIHAKIPKHHPVSVVFGCPIRFTEQDSYESFASSVMQNVYALSKIVTKEM